jgi:hypothetical protein
VNKVKKPKEPKEPTLPSKKLELFKSLFYETIYEDEEYVLDSSDFPDKIVIKVRTGDRPFYGDGDRSGDVVEVGYYEIVENEHYNLEMEKYKIKLKKYKTDLEEYKRKKKLYDAYQKEKKAINKKKKEQKERELLEKLKKKYEDVD